MRSYKQQIKRPLTPSLEENNNYPESQRLFILDRAKLIIEDCTNCDSPTESISSFLTRVLSEISEASECGNPDCLNFGEDIEVFEDDGKLSVKHTAYPRFEAEVNKFGTIIFDSVKFEKAAQNEDLINSIREVNLYMILIYPQFREWVNGIS